MLVRYQLYITYMLLLVNVMFLVNIPTLQWRAVHFHAYICNDIIS